MGTQLPPPKRGHSSPPHFSAHVYCGQMVAHLSLLFSVDTAWALAGQRLQSKSLHSGHWQERVLQNTTKGSQKQHESWQKKMYAYTRWVTVFDCFLVSYVLFCLKLFKHVHWDYYYVSVHLVFKLCHFKYTTPHPFYGPFSRTTRVSRCQKTTSGLYSEVKINRGRHTDHRLGATPARLTSAHLIMLTFFSELDMLFYLNFWGRKLIVCLFEHCCKFD